MPSTYYPATVGDYFLAALERLMERTGQGKHFGVTVLRLGALPDVAALQDRLNQIYATHPILSARMKRRFRGWTLGWQVEEQKPAPAITVHGADVKLDDAFIAKRLNERLSDAPIQLEVFQDPALLVTWRHGLLDGIGINLLLEQLATGSLTPAEEPPTPKPAEPFSKVWKRAKLGLDTLRQITCEGSRSAWPHGSPMNGRPAFRLIELTNDQSAVAFARIREKCGDFFQMPFYAALAVRAVRFLNRTRGIDSKSCHLQVPFQSGKRSPSALFQNRMGMMLLPVREAEFDEIDSAVKEVTAVYRDSMRRGLPQAMEALMQLSMSMPPGLFMPMIRFQNEGEICSLFHSHTGTFMPNTKDFAGAAMQNVFTVPSVSAPPGIGVFFSDYAGKITITLAWREGCMNEGEVQAIVNQLTEDLLGKV